MSYPILYSATETNFDHNGLGILGDCASWFVIEEANGAFELEMKYPVDGIHCENILDRCIIKAKPNQDANPQLFRVYSVSKYMSGIMSVRAEHISYDLSGIPVSAFSAESASSALSGLLMNSATECPFTFRTDKSTSAKFSVTVPGSIRSQLGGKAGSILDVYGGEYEFDNFDVILHNSRGKNRGVSIRYGKNLTDIKQDRNCSSVATGVYPYWVDSDGVVLVELPEKIINAPGTYNFVKIRTLDLSSEFETQPTAEQLRSKTESYIENNNIGVPVVSWSVSFEQLSNSDEYKHLALLERVSLFDTVNVEFPMLGVSTTAKTVKIVYNGLLERIESITLGSVKANIADTVASQQQQIAQVPTRTDVQRASAAATAWLTNGKGYKVERRDENGNTIDTLYMDTQDVNTAVNVLRIGQSGIGFSRTGVDGPYYSAWTLDGTFDASKVDVVNLIADHFYSMVFPNTLQIDSAKIRYSYDDIYGARDLQTILISNVGGGQPSINMTLWEKSVEKENVCLRADGLYMGGAGRFDSCTTMLLGYDGESGLGINGEKAKYLSWRDNGDGTYTLIGR